MQTEAMVKAAIHDGNITGLIIEIETEDFREKHKKSREKEKDMSEKVVLINTDPKIQKRMLVSSLN